MGIWREFRRLKPIIFRASFEIDASADAGDVFP